MVIFLNCPILFKPVRNRPILLKIVQNLKNVKKSLVLFKPTKIPKLFEVVKIVKIVQNYLYVLKWSKNFQCVRIVSKIVWSGPNWSNMIPNGPNIQKLSFFLQKKSKIVLYGLIWSKMV